MRGGLVQAALAVEMPVDEPVDVRETPAQRAVGLDEAVGLGLEQWPGVAALVGVGEVVAGEGAVQGAESMPASRMRAQRSQSNPR